MSVPGPLLKFHETEELGTAPDPVCSACSGCKDCTNRRRKLSEEEQQVLRRLEEGLSVDPDSGRVEATYPWKPCVRLMADNYHQVRKVQAQIEHGMRKKGTLDGFRAELLRSAEDGTVRRISDEEIAAWHGPVNYISLFAIVKPASASHKIRVVANSAQRNSFARMSINDAQGAGPNTLADLLSVLIGWRGFRQALITDLHRAYQAIHTGPNELHLRRFLFRSDSSSPWEIWGYTRCTFRDRNAGGLLEVAKKRVAEMGREIDPVAASQIVDNCFVDDLVTGGAPTDVQRMKGDKVEGLFNGTIAQILAGGAMTIKFMIVTGSQDPDDAEQLGGAVLGVPYNLASDEIEYTVLPAYSKDKKRPTDLEQSIHQVTRQEAALLCRGVGSLTH